MQENKRKAKRQQAGRETHQHQQSPNHVERHPLPPALQLGRSALMGRLPISTSGAIRDSHVQTRYFAGALLY